MIKSNNKIYSFFEVTFIFSLFSLIVFYFAKEYGLNRHWAAFPDHEVTYAYNVLIQQLNMSKRITLDIFQYYFYQFFLKF